MRRVERRFGFSVAASSACSKTGASCSTTGTSPGAASTASAGAAALRRVRLGLAGDLDRCFVNDRRGKLRLGSSDGRSGCRRLFLRPGTRAATAAADRPCGRLFGHIRHGQDAGHRCRVSCLDHRVRHDLGLGRSRTRSRCLRHLRSARQPSRRPPRRPRRRRRRPEPPSPASLSLSTAVICPDLGFVAVDLFAALGSLGVVLLGKTGLAAAVLVRATTTTTAADGGGGRRRRAARTVRRARRRRTRPPPARRPRLPPRRSRSRPECRRPDPRSAHRSAGRAPAAGRTPRPPSARLPAHRPR